MTEVELRRCARLVGCTNANWVKHEETTYEPGTLLCTLSRWERKWAQPIMRLAYYRNGWEMAASDGCQVLRRKVSRATIFPLELEYVVYDPQEEEEMRLQRKTHESIRGRAE